MKQLVLEHNKIACLKDFKIATDANNKIIFGTIEYNNLPWLIVARKRGKRIDLTYYDRRKEAYFFHHSYYGFGRQKFLDECKSLISDIIEGCLRETKGKPWHLK